MMMGQLNIVFCARDGKFSVQGMERVDEVDFGQIFQYVLGAALLFPT